MSSAVDPDPTTAPPAVRGAPTIPGGAVAAVSGALLLAACNVLAGLQPGAGTTRDLVAWFGENAAFTEALSALGLIAAALLVPGIWAVTQRLHGGAPVLAATGGWLMGTGYLMSTVLSIEALTVLSVLGAGGAPELLAAASDEHAPGTSIAVYSVFGLGALIGTVVLGAAMLRQRGAVPAWAGWALVASAPVRMIGLLTGLTLLGPPLASLLIVVAFVGAFRPASPGRRSGPVS